jgi:hypothetical protein
MQETAQPQEHEPAQERLGGFFTTPLAAADPEIAAAIHSELARQSDEIELIASENIVSRAVLEAQPKAIPGAAIMAAANSSTLPKTWPSTA